MIDKNLVMQFLFDKGFNIDEVVKYTGYDKNEVINYFENIYSYKVQKAIETMIKKKYCNEINTREFTSNTLSDAMIILEEDYNILIDVLFDFTCKYNQNSNFNIILKLIIGRAIGIAMQSGIMLVTYEEILKAMEPLKYLLSKEKVDELKEKYYKNYLGNIKRRLVY